MKKSSNSTKATRGEARPKSGPATARIEYVNPNANSVFIAGSFNEWHPGATEMLRCEGGRWVKELALPPGCHEYLLVVDGQWTPDPSALASVPNPYGGRNSAIIIPDPADAT